MYLYESKTNDALFNIATEEFFLRNFEEDFFCLYINNPSVIIGKHQNAVAEINVPYIFENNITVVRRLSGGGTVFHDSGNLNYSFILSGEKGNLIDFEKYSTPIIETLQTLGVNAYLRGKSDLVIDDLKFSGNAEHIYKNRVLHHGTMLFNSKLNNLTNAIKQDWNKFNDRAVRSNRSKVTNIINHLKQPISIDEFKTQVINTVLQKNSCKQYSLTKNDIAQIQELIDTKYSTWDWNFGYSPKYTLTNSAVVDYGELYCKTEVVKGIIREISFLLNGKENGALTLLSATLKGKPHNYQYIKELLDNFFITIENNKLNSKDILKVIF